jgi:hypothetical protein
MSEAVEFPKIALMWLRRHSSHPSADSLAGSLAGKMPKIAKNITKSKVIGGETVRHLHD